MSKGCGLVSTKYTNPSNKSSSSALFSSSSTNLSFLFGTLLWGIMLFCQMWSCKRGGHSDLSLSVSGSIWSYLDVIIFFAASAYLRVTHGHVIQKEYEYMHGVLWSMQVLTKEASGQRVIADVLATLMLHDLHTDVMVILPISKR
ncbi:hypothetical protein V8C42DRAFT_312909 [Trichoderma barbatum]